MIDLITIAGVLRPFAIDIPPSDVADLQERLARTRWPSGVTDSGGIARDAVARVVEKWRDGFRWSDQQARLNEHEQLLADLDGTAIHFVRLRAPRAGAPAILLLHGWPGSFVELLPLASLLRERFDVIVPSIPGFGFSSVPSAPGMSNARIATLMVRLMDALQYDTFAVHGGDIGAGVASWMALQAPERLRFLHLNFIPGSYWPEGAEPDEEESAFLKRRAEWAERFGAYNQIQRTTPLTAAYPLSDSPAGLAAWILEKFILWADPASTIDDDILLTNLSIYWFTNTIASSMRYYLESAATPLRIAPERRIGVATDIAEFPREMPFPPRSWVERGYAVRRWTRMPRGGHFAALEATALLAADILTSL